MKEKIFNNFTLKVLSVLCAIVLWAVIVNIYDPTTGFTISNVTVQLINTESLTDKNYTYEVVDGGKIAVYISGPKSVITDIKSSDIVATADLSKVSAFADYVDIDVKVVKEGRTLTNIEVSPRTSAVKLKIENRETKEFTIHMSTTGQPANGYVVSETSVNPATVKITGASSVISQIDDAKVICDIGGTNSDLSKNVPIVLYDVDGNEYRDDKLEMSATEVEFTAKIGASKEVPVKIISATGQAAEGFMINSIKPQTETVLVTGKKEKLDELTEIVIPKEAINVDDINEDKTININISDYIGEGLKVIGNAMVPVFVDVDALYSKDVELNTGNIIMQNLSENLVSKIDPNFTVKVSLQGAKSVLDNIVKEDIIATADLKDMTEGTHDVKLVFKLPENCMASGEYYVTVVIESRDDN